MKYTLTLILGLLCFIALWAAWQLALMLLTGMPAEAREVVGVLLAIASAWLALVHVEGKASNWGAGKADE